MACKMHNLILKKMLVMLSRSLLCKIQSTTWLIIIKHPLLTWVTLALQSARYCLRARQAADPGAVASITYTVSWTSNTSPKRSSSFSFKGKISTLVKDYILYRDNPYECILLIQDREPNKLTKSILNFSFSKDKTTRSSI